MGRGGRSWESKEAFLDKRTKGVVPIGFPGPPPQRLRDQRALAQTHRHATPLRRPGACRSPAPVRGLGGGPAARHQQSIRRERRRRRTLAGNRHVREAHRRPRLAAAAARAEGWRRPRRGFTGWSTLRAGAPLARNAARVSPRTRSAWPSWCRCGGAGPGAQAGAAAAAVWVRGRRVPPAAHGNRERRAGKARGAAAAVLEAHWADSFRGIELTLQEKPGKSEPLAL